MGPIPSRDHALASVDDHQLAIAVPVPAPPGLVGTLSLSALQEYPSSMAGSLDGGDWLVFGNIQRANAGMEVLIAEESNGWADVWSLTDGKRLFATRLRGFDWVQNPSLQAYLKAGRIVDQFDSKDRLAFGLPGLLQAVLEVAPDKDPTAPIARFANELSGSVILGGCNSERRIELDIRNLDRSTLALQVSLAQKHGSPTASPSAVLSDDGRYLVISKGSAACGTWELLAELSGEAHGSSLRRSLGTITVEVWSADSPVEIDTAAMGLVADSSGYLVARAGAKYPLKVTGSYRVYEWSVSSPYAIEGASLCAPPFAFSSDDSRLRVAPCGGGAGPPIPSEKIKTEE